MAKKKSSTKRASQGQTGAAVQHVIDARAIIDDAQAYDADTRRAIQNVLTDYHANIATATEVKELVRRAKAGETIIDLTDVEEGYRDAARAFVGFLDSGYVPDFLFAAITTALDEAARLTGAKFWIETTPGEVETGGYSISTRARVFASATHLRLEFEPKKDLAELLSAVLRHADTPEVIAEAIRAAMCQINEDVSDPRYLALIIEAARRALASGRQGGA